MNSINAWKLFDLENQYRFWIDEDDMGARWEGQYVTIKSINFNDGIVEVEGVMNNKDYSYPKTTEAILLSFDEIVAERLVHTLNGNLVYENDLVTIGNDKKHIYRVGINKGEAFIEDREGYKEIIDDYLDIKVIGNMNEDRYLWEITPQWNGVNDHGDYVKVPREEHIRLQAELITLESRIEELNKENKRLEVENQYAEYYTKTLRQQNIEKDELINKLKKEKAEDTKSNDFFLDVQVGELNNKSIAEVISEILNESKWKL